MVLAGEMDLRRLLDLCAERLGVRIDYDPKMVAGSVTVRTPRPIGDQELWTLANQLLASRGLTTVRGSGSGGGVSVVRLADAAAMAHVETEHEFDPVGTWTADLPPPAFVSASITLKHVDRQSVTKAVQPLLSKPGGSVSSLGEHVVVLSDQRSRVAQGIDVVRRLDIPAPAGGLEAVAVENMPAAAMSQLATDVASKLGDATGQPLPGSLVPSPDGRHVLVIAPAGAMDRWRGLIARLDQREPVISRTYTVRWHSLSDVAALVRDSILSPDGGRPADERQRVTVDSLSGSLVIATSERQHLEIADLLARLDQAPAETRRPMRTYEVRNRSAQEVLGLLRQLLHAPTDDLASGMIDAGGLPPTTTGFAVESFGASAGLPGVDREGRGFASPADTNGLALTADDATNTIIAIGEPRQLERIESLLPTLDRRQAQVELEVLILSLTEGDTLDLGAEIEYLTTQQSTDFRLASLFGLSSGSNANRTASGIGGTALILDPGDFAVVLRALQTLSKGRSLSMPRLLAGNNRPATINSVLQQPFTSTNASDTVATTSFGGTQDAGTNVTITPTIAAGDHVVLEYRISISAFVGESSSPNLPPARQQNSLSGSVTVPDGHTVAIGGLRLASEAKARSQVPLLAQVPVLGEAFKNRSNSASDSRFYVFIRPNVLRHRSFEDLKRLSAAELQEAGLPDGFPAVEPRVIP